MGNYVSFSTNKQSEMQGLRESALGAMCSFVSGVDEAGRGPLAGPVVAAAVVLLPEFSHPDVIDSKKITERKRELLFDEIKSSALCFAISEVWPREIEVMNVREASRFAMEQASEGICSMLQQKNKQFKIHFLVDGNVPMHQPFSNEAVVKGDAKFVCISAASILAKVHRDRLMRELDVVYPVYGFSKHKGYPTKAHKEAVAKNGPCEIHRRTFSGVKEYI